MQATLNLTLRAGSRGLPAVPAWLSGTRGGLIRSGLLMILAALAYALVMPRVMPTFGLVPQMTLPLLAVFVAAALSAVAGFAFSALCGALLFHVMDAPLVIVQVLIVCSIANQALAVFNLRNDIVWRRLRPFLVAGAMGVPLGIYVLLHSDPHDYIKGFGALLVTHSVWSLWRREPVVRAVGPRDDAIVALLAGVIGGVTATPGTVMSIWLARRGWSKAEQRAVVQPFILTMQGLSLTLLLLFAGHGGGATGFDPALLVYLPVSLLGTTFGLSVFRRMTDRQFGAATSLLLIASGLSMVV